VDYGGHPCDFGALRAATRGRGVRLLDDAAHALGAACGGVPVGSAALADATAFSFYATKNLTTGEGGALVTDDARLAERVALLALHGMDRDAWKRYGAGGSWFYEVTAAGWKYNLPDLLAALGLAQLERFEASQRRRRELVARYDAGLAAVPEVRRPRARPGITHAWHLYPVALELERLRIDRAAFIEALRAENIGTSVHFIPVHFHPYFRDRLGLAPGAFPVAEDAYRRAISLPLFAGMAERDVDDVITAVARIVAAHRA
jgi:dTDP-4-amino-4,6-dideoxygalactose transaminase